MKTIKNKKILIELIDLASGTQQRPLDPATVERYRNLMEDKVQFPPVELVHNGKDTYWLWDGFHRVAASTQLKRKHIRANIELGNLKRAIWLSYSANTTHGLPRQAICMKPILEEILADEQWSKLSERKIADHVGCTAGYVHKIKVTLTGARLPVSADEDEDDDDEQASSEPTEDQESPIKDDTGAVIPDHLSDRFLARAVIQDMVKQLSGIKNQVKNDEKMTFALLNLTGFEADVKTLRNRLKSAIPYAICPYCQGQCCNACHQMGFVNKETYEVSPKKGK